MLMSTGGIYFSTSSLPAFSRSLGPKNEPTTAPPLRSTVNTTSNLPKNSYPPILAKELKTSTKTVVPTTIIVGSPKL